MFVMLLQSLIDPSVVWVLIPLTALAIPIVAILVNPMKALIKRRERAESRKLYERIVMEKLDVMKTAIAMGFSQEDLNDLDSRLEKLVGSARLRSLLDAEDPKPPTIEEGLLHSDLADELELLNQRKSQKSR